MKLKFTFVVDDFVPEQDIGIKEAIAVDLEKYGNVQVLQVEVWAPEQLAMNEIVPTRPAAGLAASANGRSPVESTAVRAGRQISVPMVCCLSCVNYIKKYGWDESGMPYWGQCRESGKWVYNLKDQCSSHDARGQNTVH